MDPSLLLKCSLCDNSVGPHLKSDCDVLLGRRHRRRLLYIHAHLLRPLTQRSVPPRPLPLVLLPHLVVSELWGSRFIAQVESTMDRWGDVPYGDMGRIPVTC